MIEQVAIYGGTHGNELTGSSLVRHWVSSPAEVQRASFQSKVIWANPKATSKVQRYIDHDLNRCFLPRDLRGNTSGYEFERARQIVNECGGEEYLSQCVHFDLHTTTSNMGATVIITSVNMFNLGLAFRMQKRMKDLAIITNDCPREESPFVNGLSPYGFCIEVGPVAQGTLNPQAFLMTRKILSLALDCIDEWFSNGKRWSESATGNAVEVFAYDETIDYPRDSRGDLSAILHPERYGRDFVPIERGSPVFQTFDGQDINFEKDGVFWPIFVGESAYVEKHAALTLTRKERLILKED